MIRKDIVTAMVQTTFSVANITLGFKDLTVVGISALRFRVITPKGKLA